MRPGRSRQPIAKQIATLRRVSELAGVGSDLLAAVARPLALWRMVRATGIAYGVLPLIRTRADLSPWTTANAHGRQMHAAVDLPETCPPALAPDEAYTLTAKALASATKVIARADDSSGIIGDAGRRLLALHPQVAAGATVAPARLVAWMVTFQLDGDLDYLEIDPVS